MLRRYLGLAVGFVLIGAVVGACKASTSDAPASGTKCTAGNYVFCRCEDRSEGTKLCRDDGVSFDDCKCDGTEMPITEDPDAGGGFVDSGPLMGIDSGGPSTTTMIDAKCINKMGVVAGGDDGTSQIGTNEDLYVVAYTAVGTFTGSKQSGLGIRGPATILPVGTSLIATFNARYQYMGWAKLTNGGWSVPESLGDFNTDTSKPSSMTVIAGGLRAFYLDLDGHFHMGSYSATTSWGDFLSMAAPVAEPPGDAGAGVPGPSGPAGTAIGASLTMAFTGNDGSLARENFSSGSWSAVTTFAAPVDAYPATPAITALDSGGTNEALMVYAGSDLLLHATARLASNHNWGAPSLVDTAANSTDLALTSLPGGKALLVFRASNNAGFYSVWSPTTGFAAPAELVPGKNPELASVPSVTRGQCGGADASIAYAQKDGLVKIVRYSGGTMSAPYDVGGVSKATWVGIGEMP